MSGLVYINGEFFPEDKAKVSVYNRGFLYGEGLFETMRAYNGQVFLLEEHIRRLLNSSKLLGFTLPYAEGKLVGAIMDTLKANSLKDAYIRLVVTFGEGFMVRGEKVRKSPTLVVFARKFSGYPVRFYEEGMRGAIVSVRRNEKSFLSRLKSLNFLESLLAKKEAQAKGADEGIMLNSRGYVAEGAFSNIFIVKDETLVTPPIEAGVLPGITRACVIRLAQENGITVLEKEFKPAEIAKADECFLTNSLMEIVPLTEVEKTLVGEGKVGKITACLYSFYRTLVSEGI